MASGKRISTYRLRNVEAETAGAAEATVSGAAPDSGSPAAFERNSRHH